MANRNDPWAEEKKEIANAELLEEPSPSQLHVFEDKTRKSSTSTTGSNATSTTAATEEGSSSEVFVKSFIDEEDEIVLSRWKARLRHENLIDRSREEEILQKCCNYFKQKKHSAFIMITGSCGSGKTRLVRKLANANQDFYFLSGKFNLRGQLQPYAAIISALSQLVPAAQARDEVDQIRSAVSGVLQAEEKAFLSKMIPSLEPLLSTSSVNELESVSSGDQSDYAAPSQGTGGSDGVQRFVLVFRSFLKGLCSAGRPIVLHLDDLHWADACSLDVLRTVVSDQHKGFVLVGTADNDSIWMSPRLMDLKKSCCVPVELHNLDLDGVRQFVSHSLEYDEKSRECESLVDIVSRYTGGNLLYMKEFLLWAQEAELLYFRGRWVWDTAAFDASLSDPISVVEFLGNMLEEKLPAETKDVLKIGACLGSHQLNEHLLEYILGHPVREYLEQARGQGILSAGDDGAYCFVHDKLQEASYCLIPELERELFHLEVGRRLWRKLDKEELETHVFTLLSQFEIGRRLVTREKERVRLATLCLHAGSKAAKSTSYFCTAVICFELGISLLAKTGWKDHYALTLALHTSAAEMQLCTANFDRVNQLAGIVEKRARAPLDKIQAVGTQISVLGVTDKQCEAVDLGIELLTSLKEPLPKRRFHAHTLYEMAAIMKLLKGKSNFQIIRLPELRDPVKIACLHVLQLMYLNCLFVRPELAPLVAMKIVKITLKNGVSPVSCMGFASLGMLALTMGDIDKAFHFGELSLLLLETCGAVEYMPRVYAAFYGVIYSWKNPITHSLEPLLRAHRVGLQTGDVEFASLCSSCYCFLAFDAGVPLGKIMGQWTVFEESMVSNQQTTFLKMAMPFLQTISFYADTTEDPFSLKGKWMDLKREEEKARTEGRHSVAKEIKASIMMVLYMFGAFDDGNEDESVDFDHTCATVHTVQLVHVYLFRAMAYLALAARGRKRGKNLQKTKQTLHQMKKWARKCPHNCSEKRLLIEAELASVLGKPEKAYEKYVCAAAVAKDSGILFTQALANERTGYHLFKLGRKEAARPFFEEASSIYDSWGGRAKAMHLRAKVDAMYME